MNGLLSGVCAHCGEALRQHQDGKCADPIKAKAWRRRQYAADRRELLRDHGLVRTRGGGWE